MPVDFNFITLSRSSRASVLTGHETPLLLGRHMEGVGLCRTRPAEGEGGVEGKGTGEAVSVANGGDGKKTCSPMPSRRLQRERTGVRNGFFGKSITHHSSHS